MRKKPRQRWLPLSNKYTVYLCQYIDTDKPVSRHHISGYSQCSKISDIDEIEDILSPSQLNILMKQGDLVVADIETINRIIDKLSSNNKTKDHTLSYYPYTYIIIKKQD